MTLLRRWVELWDRREAPTSLAITRILVGLVLLADLLDARLSGALPGVWAPPPYGLGWGTASDLRAWFGATPETAILAWWLAVGFATLLVLGAATRVAGFGFALVSAQLAMMAPDGDRGIDILLRVVTVVLALSGAGARFSVDAWVRRRVLGRPPPTLVPAWPRYLLIAQLIWVYFSAAHNRSDPSWGPLGGFSALGGILADPHFSRLEPGWTASVYPLTQLATAATMAFEYSSPMIVLLIFWWRTPERPGRLRRLANRYRIRWAWMALGATFHLGIAVTMRLGIFPFGVLALYPLLVHPDEWAALHERWRDRRTVQ